MHRINYDFSKFESIFSALRSASNKNMALSKLKTETNQFFKDCTCKEIIYTKNTDKPFFGMRVYPELYGGKETIYDIIVGENDIRISHYRIEIDSKLFQKTPEMGGFTTKEVLAMYLHEIGHLVNDTVPIKKLRKIIDRYQIDNHTSLNLSKVREYDWLLKFGIVDTLRKITSIFENEEVAADEFVFACGYGEDLESALKKIKTEYSTLNKAAKNDYITLSWCLRIYTDLSVNRIPAIHHLNKAIRMSGSEYDRGLMASVMNRLKKVEEDDPDAYKQDENVQESTIYKKGYLEFKCITESNLSKTIMGIKYNGVKSFDNDYYEFFMRMRNVEDEDEAMLLMRQINTRISILSEIIENEGEKMDEFSKKKYFNMYDKYLALRDKLAAKATYRDRGTLVVNYPEIIEGRR
jgi:hypothetical protein